MRQHGVDQLRIGHARRVQPQFGEQGFLGAHGVDDGLAGGGDQRLQRGAIRGSLEVFNDLGLRAAVADHGQGVARGAALGVVINRDVRHGVGAGSEGQAGAEVCHWCLLPDGQPLLIALRHSAQRRRAPSEARALGQARAHEPSSRWSSSTKSAPGAGSANKASWLNWSVGRSEKNCCAASSTRACVLSSTSDNGPVSGM